jgi:hypothetical protein
MGRPKISDVRDMQLKLNLTATEYECLVNRAKAVGMRPAHFSRALVLNTQISYMPNHRAPCNDQRLSYLALSVAISIAQKAAKCRNVS